MMRREKNNANSPGFVVAFLVQFGLAFFAVVVIRSRLFVHDPDAEAVLPDLALVALDEAAVGVRLVVAALVLLEATDAARNLAFGIASILHGVVDDALGRVRIVVGLVDVDVGDSLEDGVQVDVRIFVGAVSAGAVPRGGGGGGGGRCNLVGGGARP